MTPSVVELLKLYISLFHYIQIYHSSSDCETYTNGTFSLTLINPIMHGVDSGYGKKIIFQFAVIVAILGSKTVVPLSQKILTIKPVSIKSYQYICYMWTPISVIILLRNQTLKYWRHIFCIAHFATDI
jgi:hypothetical protein